MGKNKHLANPLIHGRVGRQRRHLAARQLHQPHLALLGHHLRAHEADLLLRGRGLGLDLPDELGVGCQRFVVAVWGGGGLLMPDELYVPTFSSASFDIDMADGGESQSWGCWECGSVR